MMLSAKYLSNILPPLDACEFKATSEENDTAQSDVLMLIPSIIQRPCWACEQQLFN